MDKSAVPPRADCDSPRATKTKAKLQISVVLPCYNEEAVLPKVFERLGSAADSWGVDYEIICVDDGSKDHTWDLLRAQHEADKRWRCLSFARNFGHQAAVSAGLFYARGDAVVIMDADLQDPPEEVSRLIAKWQEGFQVVFAVRKKRKDPLIKSILAWGFYRLMSRISEFEIPLDAGDFCLLDRRVVKVLNALPERNRYLRGLRSWCGFRQTSVEFERSARAAGVPQYTFQRSLKLALDGLFSFSPLPLRLATYLGLWVSTFAFLGVVFTVIQKLFAEQFSRIGLAPNRGYPTVIITILFLGGVQLICLGILGEYIGRIYDEVKGRPLWLLRDSAGVLPSPSETNARLEAGEALQPASDGQAV
jgi:dolichol-phosphate mannosyltransferase